MVEMVFAKYCFTHNLHLVRSVYEIVVLSSILAQSEDFV